MRGEARKIDSGTQVGLETQFCGSFRAPKKPRPNHEPPTSPQKSGGRGLSSRVGNLLPSWGPIFPLEPQRFTFSSSRILDN